MLLWVEAPSDYPELNFVEGVAYVTLACLSLFMHPFEQALHSGFARGVVTHASCAVVVLDSFGVNLEL